jgi:hypothetical protein
VTLWGETSQENLMSFRFDKVERRSGYSTYMILHEPRENRVRAYWNLLEGLGCSYESMHSAVLRPYLLTTQGLYLYFHSRSQTQPKLRAFIDFMRQSRCDPVGTRLRPHVAQLVSVTT